MRIGIDIDGVLNSQYNFCIDYGSKFCDELGAFKIEDINVLNSEDMFLWGEENAHKFWNKYRKDLAITLPAKTFAAEVIDKLKKEGNEIYIITSRRNGDEWFSETLKHKVFNITKKWLRKNKIHYDILAFDVKDKGKYCKQNNIDCMIEDDPHNLRKLIGNTHVIVFDYPFNRAEEFASLTRAYSWYDIYHKIKEMKK